MTVKLIIKMSVYFVTNVLNFIINIVSTNGNENKPIDTDAFHLQARNKKSGQSFYVLTFLFLIFTVTSDIVIYFSVFIKNHSGNILK